MIKRATIFLLIAATLLAGFQNAPARAADRQTGPALAVAPQQVETIVATFFRGSAFGGAADTYLQYEDGQPSLPHGGETRVHLAEKGYFNKRPLLRFDVSTIPAAATVVSARLDLYVAERYPDSAGTVSLYYLLQPWAESSANWYDTGSGTPWSIPGASGVASDREEAPVASATLNNLGAYNAIDITAAVRRWAADPGANNGLLLIAGNYVDSRLAGSEDTRETARPRLTVTYQIPSGYTPSPTPIVSPTPGGPTPTPTSVATVIRSTGLNEALGPSASGTCIEAYPGSPGQTSVLLVWDGTPSYARLTFLYSGNNDRHHSIQVNGQTIGVLPGDNWKSVCTLGSSAELFFDPAILVSGINTITILADVPGETNSWSMQYPRIEVGGSVRASDIRNVQVPNSFDPPHPQSGIVQRPIGHDPATRVPLVIGVHGWGGMGYDAMLWLAQAASERGWLLACPDIQGGSKHTPTKVVQHEVVDLVDYMVNDPLYRADPSRVYLVGASMGGMIAATVAAKYPDRFAALAELKGPTNVDAWYNEQPGRQTILSGELQGTPGTNPFAYQSVSSAKMPMNLAHLPALIVHGTSDTIVPYHHATDLATGMAAFGGSVRLEPYNGGHYDDHPAWGAVGIMSFLSPYTLATRPLSITVRTDEPKSYYWLGINYAAAGHWTSVQASFDPERQLIWLDVDDERATPLAVDVTLDLARMGLPTGVSYTVEETDLETGDFRQYTLTASTTSLVLNIPYNHRRLTLSPRGLPPVQTLSLQQGQAGYAGASDAYIDVFARDTNYEGQSLWVSNAGNRSPLLRFDLSPIPQGMVVKAARLNLYTVYNSVTTLDTTVYRLLLPWTAAHVTWNRADTDLPWATPGALGAERDYAAAPVAQRTLNGSKKWYSYNLTELVQTWLRDPNSNNGVLVRGSGSSGGYQFAASDSGPTRPELVVVYAQATPTPTVNPSTTPSITPSRTPTLHPTATGTIAGANKVYLPGIWK